MTKFRSVGVQVNNDLFFKKGTKIYFDPIGPWFGTENLLRALGFVIKKDLLLKKGTKIYHATDSVFKTWLETDDYRISNPLNFFKIKGRPELWLKKN